MSTINQTLTSREGRTAVITLLLSLIMLYVLVALVLVPADSESFFSFLYKDVTLPDEERFNWALVAIESILLTLFYLFFTIFLGSMAEIQNRLPSWTELFVSGIITIALAYFVPKISIGEITLEGGGGSGYNHNTPDMQLAVFLLSLLGIVLMTLYLFYSQPAED